MYLIDSDVLIDYLKGKDLILKKIVGLEGGLWSTSIICVAEILEGVPKKNGEMVRKMLKDMKVYEIDWMVAETFARVRKDLREKGSLIENMDLLVASTCIANNLVLITNNKKHFSRIKGLKIL